MTYFPNAPLSIFSHFTFSQPWATFPSPNLLTGYFMTGKKEMLFFFPSSYFCRSKFQKYPWCRHRVVCGFEITYVSFQLSRCWQTEWNWREWNILYCSVLIHAVLLLSLSLYSCHNSTEEPCLLQGCTFCMAAVLSRKKQTCWYIFADSREDFKLFIEHYWVKIFKAICLYRI